MRAALALLGVALGIASAPIPAQSERDTQEPRKGHTVRKDSEPRRSADEPRRPRAQKSDPDRPQDLRARERTARDPAPDHRGHTVSKDSQPPKGAPSKAQQMQQQQHDRRLGQERLGDDRPQAVQCRARPVCGGGGYGVCQEVAQTYGAGSNLRSSRRDIVRRCEQANTPDPCQCAAQCELVAQCSIF